MKKRMLDPEFFSDDRIANCGPIAQMLYLGLLCQADVEGKIEDRPIKIKAKLFPYFEVDIDEELSKLELCGVIARYKVDNIKVILIVGFDQLGITYNQEKAAGLPNRPTTYQIPTSYPPAGDQVVEAENQLNTNNNINNNIITSKEGECEGKPINTPVDNSKQKPSKTKKESAQLPDELPPTVEGARASLEKWLKWKESRREGYQKIGLDSLITKLAKFESKTITDAIEDSISNGWKGLFPEKITRKNSAPFRETQHERNQRILRENHEKYSQPITPFSTDILFLTEDK